MAPASSRIDDTWRSFFSERCHPDVAALARAYPDRRSLYVDLVDLYGYDSEFTVAFFDAPARFLRRAVEVLCDGYDAFDHVNVRVTNNPALFQLSDLGASHLQELVTVEGVADSIDPVGAMAAVAAFACDACGEAVEVRPYGVEMPAPVTAASVARLAPCGSGRIGRRSSTSGASRSARRRRTTRTILDPLTSSSPTTSPTPSPRTTSSW